MLGKERCHQQRLKSTQPCMFVGVGSSWVDYYTCVILQFKERDSLHTNDIDFNLSRNRRNVILKLQSVRSFVWTHARRDCQLCERRLRHHRDTLVSAQLFLSKGPLRNRGGVSSDGDPDGERLRNNHLQTLPEATKVKCRSNCRQRSLFKVISWSDINTALLIKVISIRFSSN